MQSVCTIISIMTNISKMVSRQPVVSLYFQCCHYYSLIWLYSLRCSERLQKSSKLVRFFICAPSLSGHLTCAQSSTWKVMNALFSVLLVGEYTLWMKLPNRFGDVVFACCMFRSANADSLNVHCSLRLSINVSSKLTAQTRYTTNESRCVSSSVLF